MSLNSCPQCKGAKKMLGLGLITEDCSVCKGIGYISKVLEKPEKKTIVAKKVKKKLEEVKPDEHKEAKIA